ncbi:MAG TPA: hypothetical protein GX707_20970 [Epulopiscium sp.]|nr:hypothetical protein [Candidatus Epulonipiscium sp.]
MSTNIDLDKFYTPVETAKKCINLFYETFPNTTEIIEPSAGAGVFSLQIDECIAYDIEPEHESIIQQDFLELDIPYKKGRAFIGNPPFGNRNNLSRSFYKQACKMGDMIGFILPISQMNNSDSLYLFDLVKSVDLGVLEYSGMKVHCCFNLYSRPINGVLNSKPRLQSSMFTIYRDDQSGYDEIDFDLCIFRRGASIGKEKFENIHTQTYKIVVNDKNNIAFVRDSILNFDWQNYKKHQSAPSLSKNDIYRVFL